MFLFDLSFEYYRSVEYFEKLCLPQLLFDAVYQKWMIRCEIDDVF